MIGSNKGNWGDNGLQAFWEFQCLDHFLFYLINPIIEHF